MKISKIKLSMYIMNSIIPVFFIQILFGTIGFIEISKCLEGIFFILLVICALLCDSLNKNSRVQLAIILFTVSIFWFVAFISPRTIKSNWYIVIEGLICLIIADIFYVAKMHTLISTKSFHIIKGNIWILGISLSFFLLSLPVLRSYPFWDASCYTQAIDWLSQHFNFWITNIYDYYLCGHASTGYTLFLFIGKFLFPNGDLGILFMQLLIGVLSIFSFGGIINSIFPNISNIEKTLLLGLYAFSPFVLGMVGDISLDYGMLCFFTIFIYLSLKKWIILKTLVAVILCFTKEPALIIYAGYIFGIYAIQLIQCVKKRKNIFSLFKNYEIYIDIFPILFWILLFFFKGSIWGSSGGEGINYFGYSQYNFIAKTKQFMILNFNWLIWGNIFILCLYFIIKKKKIIAENFFKLIPIICGIFFFIIFNYLYFTVTHSRYILPVVIVSSLLLGYVCTNISSHLLRLTFLLTINILLFIQSFIGIDPLTHKMFTSVNVGKKEITCLSYTPNIEFNDSIIYNREYLEFIDLLNQAFNELDLNEMDILAVDQKSFLDRWLQAPYELMWDKAAHRLKRGNGDSIFPIPIINIEDRMQYQDQRIIYITPTWINDVEWELESPSTERTITYKNWELRIYELF